VTQCRSVFLTHSIPRRTERRLCRLVSLNERHPSACWKKILVCDNKNLVLYIIEFMRRITHLIRYIISQRMRISPNVASAQFRRGPRISISSRTFSAYQTEEYIALKISSALSLLSPVPGSVSRVRYDTNYNLTNNWLTSFMKKKKKTIAIINVD